ncbi:fibronectin type III domain-containing protein, partial [Vibrio alginolyticus]|uniref:fibronectin type III domain-containing protein n=1 Tax=Vibrio alginolyticus TaxID=663 RepID=UPI001A8FC39B
SASAGCDDDERPAAPHSLRANPLGATGIMLQWSSNAGHYDIYTRDKQGRPVPEAPDITGGATNRNYLEFYGLKPDKEYFFS